MSSWRSSTASAFRDTYPVPSPTT
ncbi:CRISPR-associated protein Cas5 [Streptomyces cyaneofuscatus]